MRNNHEISRIVDNVEQDRRIHAVYGSIVDILSLDDQEYYIPLVLLEGSHLFVESQSHYIPLDEPPEQLATNYGSPRDLIGYRVRVDYYGNKWMAGVARIVPGRDRVPIGNTMELPSRGFRYAVAGGGTS